MKDETQTTDKEVADKEVQPAGAAPEFKPEKKADPKPKAKAAEPTFKFYRTPEKHSIPFDVQIRGEVIQGTWSRDTGKVEFMVPTHLVEGFELHHHFVMGNVKPVETAKAE